MLLSTLHHMKSSDLCIFVIESHHFAHSAMTVAMASILSLNFSEYLVTDKAIQTPYFLKTNVKK